MNNSKGPDQEVRSNEVLGLVKVLERGQVEEPRSSLSGWVSSLPHKMADVSVALMA
uniref:Uncharacterized protein n=1 Tax=Anguilla anguilla TaxID=7936 RepID=A0A0E9QB39_ANGAN